MLRFEAERGVLRVNVIADFRRTVEEVAAVELDGRLGRFDLHDATGFRVFRDRAEAHFARFRLVENAKVIHISSFK